MTEPTLVLLTGGRPVGSGRNDDLFLDAECLGKQSQQLTYKAAYILRLESGREDEKVYYVSNPRHRISCTGLPIASRYLRAKFHLLMTRRAVLQMSPA